MAVKDEFLNIKNVNRDNILATNHVPPHMMMVIPNNVGGFEDVEKAGKVLVRNELIPIRKRLEKLNR